MTKLDDLFEIFSEFSTDAAVPGKLAWLNILNLICLNSQL